MQAKLALTLILVLPLLLALEMALRSYKRARGGLPNRSAIELLTGLQVPLPLPLPLPLPQPQPQP